MYLPTQPAYFDGYFQGSIGKGFGQTGLEAIEISLP